MKSINLVKYLENNMVCPFNYRNLSYDKCYPINGIHPCKYFTGYTVDFLNVLCTNPSKNLNIFQLEFEF